MRHASIRLAPAVAAAVLAACSRDLDLPTERSRLQLVQAFVTVAPREAFALQATGGTPPYTYAFAVEGQGSGPSASVDAATGAYRAGHVGPAFDLVEVHDAAGAVAAARVTVGAPVSAAPLEAMVAPNGTLTILPRGGTGSYAFDLAPGARGSMAGSTWRAPASGSCWAAPIEPFTETVTVHDDTDAPGVTVKISVLRGLDAVPVPGASVAPLGRLAVVGTGGQAPYAYELADPAFGGTILASGAYRAGATGDRADTVRITDANAQVRCLAIQIGPELALTVSTSDLRPGIAARAIASGGQAPYAFDFAARGNRSGGTVDPVTGAYVPGFAAGATDLLVVSDAAGASLATPLAAHVGDLQLAVGAMAGACATGDVDGDGRADLGVVDGSGHVRIALTRAGAMPEVQAYNGLQGTVSLQLRDVDGDGLADLVATNQMSQVLVALADPSGRLVDPVVIGGVSGIPAVLSSPTTFVYATNSASIASRDWPAGATTAGPQVTLKAVAAAAVAAGNFVGDSSRDVAWVDYSGSVHVSTGPGYADDVVAPGLPAGTRAVRLRTWRHAGASRDALLVQLAEASGLESWSGAVEVTSPTGTGLSTIAPVTLMPGGVRASGLAPFDAGAPGTSPGTLGVAAVNGSTGDVAVIVDPFGAASTVAVEARRVAPGCVTTGDFDRDGLPELVLAGAVGEIVAGEGRGRFGVRPHPTVEFQAETPPGYGGDLAVGDLDGDGRDDVAALVAGQRLEVLLGTGAGLAFTEGVRLPAAAGAVALLGDLDGDGAPDVLLAPASGGLWVTPGSPAGGVGAPVELPLTVGMTATRDRSVFSPSLSAAALGGAAPGPDLLVQRFDGSYTSSVIAVVRDAGGGGRTFQAPLRLDYLVRAYAADLDGDGTTDIVVPNAAIWTRVTVSGGEPSFSADQPLGALPGSHAVAGVRRSGVAAKQELVLVARGATSTEVTLVRDTGPVVWALSTTFSPWRARLADLDGDGTDDLVVDDGAGVAHVFTARADGGFDPVEAAQLFLPGRLVGTLRGPGKHALLVGAALPGSWTVGSTLMVVPAP